MALPSYSLAVVAAVNDDKVLRDNLANSPMLRDGRVPLIVEHGYQSASKAYNAALDSVAADIVIFAHQDVYLPQGWDEKLLLTIQALEANTSNWAVLGVIGLDQNGHFVGRVWSTGLGCEIKGAFSGPTAIGAIDEMVIVLRRATGLRFDEELPGYHLYGTDIVQTALQKDYGAYVFDGPVIHNSLPAQLSDGSYATAYRYMRRKWKPKMPIWTTVVPVTRWGWPLLRATIRGWVYRRRKYMIKRAPARQQYARLERPSRKAQDLGYE